MADTPLDLDAVEARANAATEGPWVASLYLRQRLTDGPYTTQASVCLSTAGGMPVCHTTDRAGWEGQNERNARFIAHARTDVPALVARVRALEADAARMDWLEQAVPSGAFREASERMGATQWDGSVRALIDVLRSGRTP